MKFAAEKRWDKIACGYAINEGGNVVIANGKVKYVGIQASEKVSVNVDVIAQGTPAMPRYREKTIRSRIWRRPSPKSELTRRPWNSTR